MDNIPTILVIFGATGDLTKRYLLVSLYNLYRQGLLPDQFKIIANGRRHYSTPEYLEFVSEFIKKLFPNLLEENQWNEFKNFITYLEGDITVEQTYQDLALTLNKLDNDLGVCTHKIFHLAIAPSMYKDVLNGLKISAMHQTCRNVKDTRIVIEKPFGDDLETFRELNQILLEQFDEHQIFRIDHYLGKETVQNILYFRSANPIMIDNWDSESIEKIEVQNLETLGVGTRGDFYDSYGQTKDMIQSHVLQLLALVLVELPEEFDSDKLNEAKARVLASLEIENIEDDVIRGQYTKGVVDGKPALAYTAEEKIAKDSKTETFVRIKAISKLPEWRNTEIVLTSGKRLPERVTRIIITFKEKQGIHGLGGKNKLTFTIQPSQKIQLLFQVKSPSLKKLETVEMDFDYVTNFKRIFQSAYEKILLDVIRLDKSNFISADQLEASWVFTDKIINYWESNNSELFLYPAGSDELL